MAKMFAFEYSDGDTPEFVRVDYQTPYKHSDFESVLAFIKLTIPSGSRRFDMQRKCWFIESMMIEPVVAGLKILQKHGQLSGAWVFIDKRSKSEAEAFEEFFQNTTGLPMAAVPETKASLESKFRAFVITNTSLEVLPSDEPKKVYRKAAIQLHPDKNPANAPLMSELNSLWSKLQPLL